MQLPVLKEITYARIKSAKYLIDRKDWQGSAQMMGLALECALKACICRSLRIPSYPETHKDKQVPSFFMTHRFDRLLLLSGLSDIFNASGLNPTSFRNWGDFTIYFQGDWIEMRYDPASKCPFDEPTTKNLYQYIYRDKNSIIKTISNKKRW